MKMRLAQAINPLLFPEFNLQLVRLVSMAATNNYPSQALQMCPPTCNPAGASLLPSILAILLCCSIFFITYLHTSVSRVVVRPPFSQSEVTKVSSNGPHP